MAACSVAQHQGDKGMPADQPAGCILGQELLDPSGRTIFQPGLIYIAVAAAICTPQHSEPTLVAPLTLPMMTSYSMTHRAAAGICD